MKPLLITSGEPAGIGPDLCLDLVNINYPLVILCNKQVLLHRAKLLNRNIYLHDYEKNKPIIHDSNNLTIIDLPCPNQVVPGQLDIKNANYVVNMLSTATSLCLNKEFSALVTAPVHKGIINDAGVTFSGHTEFLQEKCNVKTVVMMFYDVKLKVALMTTHLPLRDVPRAITIDLIIKNITCLNNALKKDFAIKNPKILMAGLNPHAGENGYLGDEELKTIIPAINILRAQNIDLTGPFPADTLFTKKYIEGSDIIVAMYHDQGLTAFKYANFDTGVNITLGLPIIRTSVDHGTALDLAGKNIASSKSLIKAVGVAWMMTSQREKTYENKLNSCN